jgi:hypothetical protein
MPENERKTHHLHQKFKMQLMQVGEMIGLFNEFLIVALILLNKEGTSAEQKYDFNLSEWWNNPLNDFVQYGHQVPQRPFS